MGAQTGFGGGSRLDVGLAATAAASGLMAGVAIAKSEFYIPKSIQSALRFESENCYIVALAFMVTVLVVNIVCNITDRDNRLYITQRGVAISSIGSFILGLGMAMAGSDMLSLWVQVGTACESALWTVAGAMGSGLTFFMLYDNIKDSSKLLDEPYLDRMISKKKNVFPFVAGGFLVLLLAVCGVINIDGVSSGLNPKAEDFIPDPRKSKWSPYAVGLLLGLASFPMRMFYRARLQGYCGWVSSICFPVNQICELAKINRNNYIRYIGSVESLWVFIMGVGVTCGAAVAAYFSGDLDQIKTDNWVLCLIGGYLMMSGSLLAEGDLYSQLSGVADLHIPSVLNVACIMAGGFLYGPIYDLCKDLF